MVMASEKKLNFSTIFIIFFVEQGSSYNFVNSVNSQKCLGLHLRKVQFFFMVTCQQKHSNGNLVGKRGDRGD